MSEQKPAHQPEFRIDPMQAQSEPDIQVHTTPLEIMPVEVSMLTSLNGAPDTLRQAITAERRERATEGAHSTMRILEEKESLRSAEVDAVTGLPNRAVFERDFSARLRRSQYQRRADEALLLVDLNQLKPVNDLLGHQKGDEYLFNVARLLREAVREGIDGVYRIGGDEIALLLRGVRKTEDLEAVIKHLKSAVDGGVHYEGIATGISVGGQIIRKGKQPGEIYGSADVQLTADKDSFYEAHPEIVRRSTVIPSES